MPVSMMQGSTKYYLHYDQVGSLRAITDNSHNIVKEITYDTFGNVLTDSNEAFKIPFGFAGGLYGTDTKLTRFGYRDYDAYTGKWTAKDPIGFDGGDSNLYGYVLGDPVGFFDPLGLYIDPRLKGKVPRAMGGDGGISDAQAAKNDAYGKWALGAGAFGASVARYGWKKSFEVVCAIVLETQAIDDGKLKNPRQKPPKTEVNINWKKLIPKKYKKLLDL